MSAYQMPPQFTYLSVSGRGDKVIIYPMAAVRKIVLTEKQIAVYTVGKEESEVFPREGNEDVYADLGYVREG